ncbi:hypothetical protein MA20_22280 [Bradyrhizobium japonicum]|uniref:Uncharacterized protein n=1 Tax=Bradyrhizobium japonicum TaxID=375 RepID=A0A0A3YUH7_BRAJP|nr:hypothetical protein [Bradyrhizobium japonicum]KGT77323.1 hypothetical protein MA20_22280 [Bradyrhizobium japonicum]
MTKSYRPPNRASSAREHEPLTIERVERALALSAYLVVLDGSKVAPIFNRLERELEAMREKEDTVGRAKRLLETYRTRPPRLALAPPSQ